METSRHLQMNKNSLWQAFCWFKIELNSDTISHCVTTLLLHFNGYPPTSIYTRSTKALKKVYWLSGCFQNICNQFFILFKKVLYLNHYKLKKQHDILIIMLHLKVRLFLRKQNTGTLSLAVWRDHNDKMTAGIRGNHIVTVSCWWILKMRNNILYLIMFHSRQPKLQYNTSNTNLFFCFKQWHAKCKVQIVYSAWLQYRYTFFMQKGYFSVLSSWFFNIQSYFFSIIQ